MEHVIGFLVVVGLLALLAVGLRRALLRRQNRGRLYDAPVALPNPDDPDEGTGALAEWLSRAGYRGPGAVTTFLGGTALGLAAAVVLPFLLTAAGLSDRLLRGVAVIPGGVGDLFLPAVYLGPWLPAIAAACLPWLAVRRSRRVRVQQFEQDLPIYLELFATLSEAGLGFDAALDRILKAQPPGRPLAAEFRTFQTEVLAGRSRVRSLRRLARRVDVTTFTVFVSALVQAEQLGGGVAAVLRRQADDLRDHRRERFLAHAMTLPVKLVFPMVICFLPGLFVFTLGPVFFQFFQLADRLMRTWGAAVKLWQFVLAGSNQVAVPTVTLADGFWSRLAGLQLRPPLPQGHGLLLARCSSAHTCFMQFALDLMMLDRTWRVVEMRLGV